MKKANLSRLMGLTMIGFMVLSLTSGTVMGADEPKEDKSFHLYQVKPSDPAKAELNGFKKEADRDAAAIALFDTKDEGRRFRSFIKDHRSNPRQMMDAVHSFLVRELDVAKFPSSPAGFRSEEAAAPEAVKAAMDKSIDSLITRVGALDAKKVFGGEERKEAYLKLLKSIKDMSFDDLKKLLEDEEGGLDGFLKKVFDQSEETLSKLGVTLKLAKKDEEKKPEEKKGEGKGTEEKGDKSKPRIQPEGPALGNPPGDGPVTPPTRPTPPTPRVGEKSVDATAQKLCQDILAAKERDKQDLFNKFLAQMQDLKDRFLNQDEKAPVAPVVPPENGLLDKLSQLLGGEEEKAPEASAAQPQQPVTPPVAQNDKKNNQIPQPLPPQQGGFVPPIAQNNTASAVPAIDTTPAKTPSVGKSALSNANTVAESVKPISEMEPPAATQIIPPNQNLTPQQNAANINAYYDDAQRYVDSFKRSVSTSLAMVQTEKQNLAKQKTALSDTIDANLEKQVPDEIKSAEQIAQQELQTAQSGLKSAEQQAASMMASVDQNNAGAAQQAASQTVSQANDKIAAAQAKLAQITQAKKDWKANQGTIDTSLKNRLEKIEAAETTLAAREQALQARTKEVTAIASKNEQNRQQSLSGISQTALGSTQAANVNAISGFNPNNSNSRRNQGLSGAINQSGNNGINNSLSGQRAPLTGGI